MNAPHVPRTFGRWSCMLCNTEGIGGLSAFYMHWTKEHADAEAAKAAGR